MSLIVFLRFLPTIPFFFMNAGAPDGFARLCSLMREGSVGHIEEQVTRNAF